MENKRQGSAHDADQKLFRAHKFALTHLMRGARSEPRSSRSGCKGTMSRPVRARTGFSGGQQSYARALLTDEVGILDVTRQPANSCEVGEHTFQSRAQVRIHAPVPAHGLREWRGDNSGSAGRTTSEVEAAACRCELDSKREWRDTHTFFGGVLKSCQVTLPQSSWKNSFSHTSLRAGKNWRLVRYRKDGRLLTGRRRRGRSCADTARTTAGSVSRFWA